MPLEIDDFDREDYKTCFFSCPPTKNKLPRKSATLLQKESQERLVHTSKTTAHLTELSS